MATCAFSLGPFGPMIGSRLQKMSGVFRTSFFSIPVDMSSLSTITPIEAGKWPEWAYSFGTVLHVQARDASRVRRPAVGDEPEGSGLQSARA